MAHEMTMKNGRPAEADPLKGQKTLEEERHEEIRRRQRERGEDPDRELGEEAADGGAEEVS